MRFTLLAIPLAIVGFLATQGIAVPANKHFSGKTKSTSPKFKQLDTCVQTSHTAGVQYSPVQIAQVAQGAGFNGNGWVISVAVALAESGGWTQATLLDTDCSEDRGLWQINNRYHSEVSDAQAFDPKGCAQAAYSISSGGTDWTPWTTYTGGAYQAHMSDAQAAVNTVSGAGPSTSSGGGSSCSNFGAPCPSNAHCCSQYGYCGSTSDYCGSGCNAAASFNGQCS
ncbi:hypothetical protein BC937DRAFT_93886 [Endogone sp. FLAS-F59071]|nr:hypothetical protein BC937DRAFT_93886 [Endogone sp. FLAS-F59071]|eukprot:RUS20995.1 hypothetical protein BC937DRAFT_93886 [Endogone sp. FLAS-F59071]